VSSNAEGSHTQSYINGQQVKFVEGEIRHLSCVVNGSHPAANVRIMIDQTDISEQFTKTTQLVRAGPANVTVKQVSQRQIDCNCKLYQIKSIFIQFYHRFEIRQPEHELNEHGDVQTNALWCRGGPFLAASLETVKILQLSMSYHLL
jgi:hypothetical protein